MEAEAERVRCDAEERHVEQERHEQEEEAEPRCRRLCLESTLTLVAALETELPQSKGKGLELAPESEGVQESRRCDSCEKRDVECVQIKVSPYWLLREKKLADNPTDRLVALLLPLPGAKDPVCYKKYQKKY